GPDPARLHLLPTLWFRNTWSWGDEPERPSLRAAEGPRGLRRAAVEHPELGEWDLWTQGSATLLFCENETNNHRLFGVPNATAYVKDGINDYVVGGDHAAVNPHQAGTKVAVQHVLELDGGEASATRMRLTARPEALTPRPSAGRLLGQGFDRVLRARRTEADEFYATVIPDSLDADAALVMRQALAGMLWSKQ